jgi:hypothetical protein
MTHPPAGGTTPHAPRAMDCPEARVSLGVYVLGAIDPAERALVDAHLATCRDCRDELAGLAGLPALLARVSTEEAIALAVTDGPDIALEEMMPEPPRELLATVLDLTAARRRGRRWREAVLGLAAALIIAAGVFGGLRIGAGSAQPSLAGGGSQLFAGTPDSAWETAQGQSGTTTAAVSYRAMGWGTELDTKVTGIPVGTSCELYVIDSTGHRVLVGGWVTDDDEGSVWYPASAAVPSKDVTGFQITVAQGQTIDIPA